MSTIGDRMTMIVQVITKIDRELDKSGRIQIKLQEIQIEFVGFQLSTSKLRG